MNFRDEQSKSYARIFPLIDHAIRASNAFDKLVSERFKRFTFAITKFPFDSMATKQCWLLKPFELFLQIGIISAFLRQGGKILL